MVSDIHGNEVALDAVLDDIAASGADEIVCLGDVATLGPNPCETLARVEALGCTCIVGNHDAFLLDRDLLTQYTHEEIVVQAVDWACSQVSARDLDFVRSFVPTAELELAPGVTLLMYHGSPKSYFDNILAETPPDELDAMLGDARDAQLYAGGHTHVQMMRQHDGQLVINAGSVGMPFRRFVGGGPPQVLTHAEYAIVEASHAGDIVVDLRRVALDLTRLRAAAACAASQNPLCAQLEAAYR
ncbi:MAG: metallophosphoesterase family protein [Myxococcales bacterium]|nr:metallophosphoesterase family protein [Myxococcales bacterium]